MYIVNTALLSAVPEFPVIIDGNSQLLLLTVAYFGPLLRSTSSQNSNDQREITYKRFMGLNGHLSILSIELTL